jgi:hypothetical protein
MDLLILILEIATIFILSHNLVVRWRARRRLIIEEAGWNGTAFNANGVLVRVQALRTNYLDSLHTQPRMKLRLMARIVEACRKVGKRAYFQRDERGSERPGGCVS